MLTRLASLLAAFTSVAVLVTAAPAQARFDVGPLLALYAPVSDFQPASYYTTSLPNSPGDLTGVGWGGQGRIWFTRRFGVQVHIAWASSTVGGGNTPGGPVPSTPARVFTASAQALYNPSSTPHKVRVWLGVGAGLVRHGGAAYVPYGAPLQVATALGLGSAIPMGEHLNANLGLTTLLYSIDVSDRTGTTLEHGFQVDPLIHAGLSWSWP
jgi:hypothetical protein